MNDINKLVFIDLEYFNHNQDISQISILGIENFKIKILFNSLIKHENPVVDRVVYDVSKISLSEMNEKGIDIVEAKELISEILEGKTIVHWGGSDFKLLSNITALTNCIGLDFSSSCDDSIPKKLTLAFKKLFPQFTSLELDLHCSLLDSYMLSLIYRKTFYNLDMNIQEAEDFNKFIEEKYLSISRYKKIRHAKKPNPEGKYFSLNIIIYLTGFEAEKEYLGNMFADLGIKVASSKDVKSLTHLIYKNKDVISNKCHTKVIHLTLNEFNEYLVGRSKKMLTS